MLIRSTSKKGRDSVRLWACNIIFLIAALSANVWAKPIRNKQDDASTDSQHSATPFTIEQGACRDPKLGKSTFGGWCDCGKILNPKDCFAKAQEMPSMAVVEIWQSTQACVAMHFAPTAPADCPSGCKPEHGEHEVGEFKGDGRPFVSCLIPSVIKSTGGEDVEDVVDSSSAGAVTPIVGTDGLNVEARASAEQPVHTEANKTYWAENILGQKLADASYLLSWYDNKTNVLSKQKIEATKKKDYLSEELRMENARLVSLLQDKVALDEKIRIFTENMHKVEKEFQRIMGDSEDAMEAGAQNVTQTGAQN